MEGIKADRLKAFVDFLFKDYNGHIEGMRECFAFPNVPIFHCSSTTALGGLDSFVGHGLCARGNA